MRPSCHSTRSPYIDCQIPLERLSASVPLCIKEGELGTSARARVCGARNGPIALCTRLHHLGFRFNSWQLTAGRLLAEAGSCQAGNWQLPVPAASSQLPAGCYLAVSCTLLAAICKPIPASLQASRWHMRARSHNQQPAAVSLQLTDNMISLAMRNGPPPRPWIEPPGGRKMTFTIYSNIYIYIYIYIYIHMYIYVYIYNQSLSSGLAPIGLHTLLSSLGLQK